MEEEKCNLCHRSLLRALVQCVEDGEWGWVHVTCQKSISTKGS